jgi:hypothetical protein
MARVWRALMTAKSWSTMTGTAGGSRCWAFSTAGISSPALIEAIAAEAQAQMRHFSPQELANTAWAFAMAEISLPRLFEAITAEARAQVRHFNPQDLANTAWAFATTGISSPTLFEAIATEAQMQMRRFNSQDLANTAWAFAALGVVAPGIFELIVGMLPLRQDLGEKERPQIYQFLLFLRLEAPQLASAPLPSDLGSELRLAFLAASEPNPPQTQRCVCSGVLGHNLILKKENLCVRSS